MKKKIIFRGLATALVTPFRDGEVDLPALKRLIAMQIEGGADAIVIGGTTGEAATLSDKEREVLYETARAETAGKLPLILGTGTNDTKKAVAYTRMAERIGADGALAVTPYYNKGTAEGIVDHYLSILNSADIPIILYNVPSRTGVNLTLKCLERLAREENIAGIKEASDSADRLTEISMLKEALPLYAGNDSQIYITLALGGLGAISVASNIIPRLMKKLIESFNGGRYADSRELQGRMLDFIKALFLDTNPAPIKYLMGSEGLISPELRLPLKLPCEATRIRAAESLKKLTAT